MLGLDHATILSPSFQGVHKECLAQGPAFCVPKNDQKFRGILPEKLGGGVLHASWNSYPISHQNLWFSLPFFRPNQKFDTQTWSPGARRVTGSRDKLLRYYTVVGVHIKREMVLSPNNEEVANQLLKNIPNSRLECTNRTLFQTKMVEFRPKRLKKPYPLALRIPT